MRDKQILVRFQSRQLKSGYENKVLHSKPFGGVRARAEDFPNLVMRSCALLALNYHFTHTNNRENYEYNFFK